MNILAEIQKELKAPKNQRNSFGGYNYRSCEDILEAVKPILNKYELAIIIKDEVVAVDGGFEVIESSFDRNNNKIDKKITTSNRVYIKATAILLDKDGKEIAETSALAREEETKKGMDSAQLTGATSSYARKYALNGLFAIDDTRDADTMDNREPAQKPTPKPMPSSEKIGDTDKDDHYDDYKQDILACTDIAKINLIADDARKHCKELGWTQEQMEEFGNIIRNKIKAIKEGE